MLKFWSGTSDTTFAFMPKITSYKHDFRHGRERNTSHSNDDVAQVIGANEREESTEEQRRGRAHTLMNPNDYLFTSTVLKHQRATMNGYQCKEIVVSVMCWLICNTFTVQMQ